MVSINRGARMLELCDYYDHMDEIAGPIQGIAESAKEPRLLSDVIADLKSKKAFLFMDGKNFTILKPLVKHGKKILLVWVACGITNNSTGGILKKYLPQIKQLAKDIDATELEFWTARPSMERYAPRLGWKKAYTIFVMDV